MSILPSTPTPQPPAEEPRAGFDTARNVAAAQRESLGRGLAFALLLAVMSLAAVYIPMLMDGSGWVDGPASSERVR